jgi:protein-S-isoprenylcysteine O-methyltransferase Ste14
MNEWLRLVCLSIFGIGPGVAFLALLRRLLQPSAKVARLTGLRGYLPAFLIPVEWVLPPVLIFLGIGEIEVGWLPIRLVGLAVSLGGALFLAWAAISLGRFLVHDAAILEGHALVTGGPYRLVRHPVYTGFLAMLLGAGVATLNAWVLLIWPVSLLGILVQAKSEERVLSARFYQEYAHYAAMTGLLVPRFRRKATGLGAALAASTTDR